MNCLVKEKDVLRQSLVLPLCYCEHYKLGWGNDDPCGHSAGVYGWKCDYYELKGEGCRLVVSCGYAPCSNATPAQKNAWRKIFEETAKLYEKARKKEEAKGDFYLRSDITEKLNKKYKKVLLRKWRKYLDEVLYKD